VLGRNQYGEYCVGTVTVSRQPGDKVVLICDEVGAWHRGFVAVFRPLLDPASEAPIFAPSLADVTRPSPILPPCLSLCARVHNHVQSRRIATGEPSLFG
jgi:hypothetical protein